MMKDETNNCLTDLQSQGKRLSVNDLRNGFCERCKNPTCGHAKFANTPWDYRMLTQQDRLLDNPNFADPKDPQFDFVRKLGWENLVREAILLNISEMRADWTIPNIRPALFVPVPEQPSEESSVKTTEMVDEAVRDLAKARGKDEPDLPQPVEDLTQELSTPEVEPKPEPNPEPNPTLSATLPRSPESSQFTIRNTRVPKGGIMIGGSKSPANTLQPIHNHKAPHDPWAVPKRRMVKPGVTISLSGKKKKP